MPGAILANGLFGYNSTVATWTIDILTERGITWQDLGRYETVIMSAALESAMRLGMRLINRKLL